MQERNFTIRFKDTKEVLVMVRFKAKKKKKKKTVSV